MNTDIYPSYLTDKSKLHTKYLKKLKKLEVKEIQGLEWDKILYLESLYALDKTEIEVRKYFVKTLLTDIPEVTFNIKGSKLLFLITNYHRNDHDSYYRSIRELFDVKDEIVYESRLSLLQKIESISFKGIIQKIILYKSIYNQLDDFDDTTHRRFLAVDILICYMIKQRLLSESIQAEVVVSFFDANMFENLIIQILCKIGTISVTNQHGQPLFRSWDYDHLNQSQIFNFTSDFFLAKGYFTKKQFINAGRNADRIKVVGDMMKTDPLNWKFIKNMVFGVFLDTPTYTFAKKANIKLLKIADEIAHDLGYGYIVKLHPTDFFQNYSDLTLRCCIEILDEGSILADLFSMIDFGIMHASSVYVDMISNGVRAFQMKTDIYYPIADDLNDIFEDLDDIKTKIREWNEMSDEKKKNYLMIEGKKYLSDSFAGDEIKNFILSLITSSYRPKIGKTQLERGQS